MNNTFVSTHAHNVYAASHSQHSILLKCTDSQFVCSFVCSLYLSAPLQGTVCLKKHFVPADEGLGRVLTRPACDSLPHGRRSPSNVLFRGPSCHFDSMRRPTLAKVFTNSGCLETFQATEGGPGRVLREPACDDLPCSRISLQIF